MPRILSRRWALPVGLAVLFAAPLAVAVTTFTITGTVDVLDMSVDPNPAGITEDSTFEVEVTYDETMIAAMGTENIDLGVAPGSSFSLTIENPGTFQQTAADDLFGAPILTLEDGNFSALQFLSNPSDELGPDAITNLVASAPPNDPPDGGLEILDATTNAQLLQGSFTGIAVSPD
jgi:hypothetical protein